LYQILISPSKSIAIVRLFSFPKIVYFRFKLNFLEPRQIPFHPTIWKVYKMLSLLIPPSPENTKHAMSGHEADMLCMEINENVEDCFETKSSKKSGMKQVDGLEIFLPSDDGSPDRRVARYHCKARGVPDLHNPRNAFIDVPLDSVLHGGILICSHRTCSSSGRRFRYCTVCRCPVAKRNFVKRHGHGILKPKRRPASYVSDSDSSECNVRPRDAKRSCSDDSVNQDPLNLLQPPHSFESTRLAPIEVAWLDCRMVESVNQDDLNVWLKGIMDSPDNDSVALNGPDIVTSFKDTDDDFLFAV